MRWHELLGTKPVTVEEFFHADVERQLAATREREARAAKAAAERWHASWLLRLLLGTCSAPEALAEVDWPLLTDLARSNNVLLRASERLTESRVPVPLGFAAAVYTERLRVRQTLQRVAEVTRACDEHDIPYVLPKAFQDYPDMGDDVDLLVLPPSLDVDDLITAGLRRATARRDLGQWLAHAASYVIRDCPSPLDVQHGRLGVVGEYRAFPSVLIEGRHAVPVGEATFYTSPPEHQIVLQGLQRVSGRLRIPLGDVLFTIATIQRETLDWHEIVALARRHHGHLELSCYLSYVEQIHRDAFGFALLPDAARKGLALEGWGRVEFRDGGYRFSVARVNGRLYLGQIARRLARGDMAGAGRVCLIPVVAAQRAVRRATRSEAPAEPPAIQGGRLRPADASAPRAATVGANH